LMQQSRSRTGLRTQRGSGRRHNCLPPLRWSCQPLPAADIDELIRLRHGAAVDVSGSAALAR
jgi:hypothetical protein